MHSVRLRSAVFPVLAAVLLVPIATSPASGAVPSRLPAAAVAAADDPAELTGDIVFSLPSGTFQGETFVALSTAVSGAQIRYTTDGTLPSATSAAYSGTPVRLTKTTQVRAQAFVGTAASGAPGTALYVARSFDATHDLPVLVLDDYGKGKPGREYLDTAVMEFSPTGSTTSLSSAPTLVSRAGVHLHGQSSATFAKAPYRLELRNNSDEDADYPLLGMPADSDWVLRGPFTDKALIRDAFSYGLARDMGLKAPRSAFAEVYLNTDASAVGADDYVGVYQITETIKNTKDRLDLKKLKPDVVAEPEIEGGYIFKSEWMAAQEPTLPCAGADATCWHYLEVIEPSPLPAAQKAWLTQYLQKFHDVMHSTGYNDPVTGYSAYIDVDSFVNHIILNELGREMDGYIRSQHFYKDRGGKITAGPVWDRDLSLGVGGFFNNDQAAGWQYEQLRQPIANDWFTILLKDPAFVSKVKARWKQLRQGVLSDAQMSARIATLTAPLPNAAARNFTRWPNLTTRTIGFFSTPVAPTWQGQVTAMQEWLTKRAAWLDSSAGWDVAGTG
jgi:CotH protein/chitobiase/beta-hexosaminidase-like protein